MLKTINLIWSPLRPILLVVFVLIVIGVTLTAYDQYRTYQERRLGAKLITNIDIESSCDEIAGVGEKFNFNFTINNKNDKEVTLERIGIDINLISVGNKKFAEIINTNPAASKSNNGLIQFEEYVFHNPLKIGSTGEKSVSLTMRTASKKKAQAASHTIVVYKGTVVVYFNYDISIRSDCRIQVRYP